MKKKLALLAVLSIPALLYLNAWQSFRYQSVENEISALEDEQREWIEDNKKLIVGIEVLGSPARIDSLASEIEGLVKPREAGDFRIEIRTQEGGGDG